MSPKINKVLSNDYSDYFEFVIVSFRDFNRPLTTLAEKERPTVTDTSLIEMSYILVMNFLTSHFVPYRTSMSRT